MGAWLAQLVITLTKFPTVARVCLWLDGAPATTLGGEGLVVDQLLSRVTLNSGCPQSWSTRWLPVRPPALRGYEAARTCSRRSSSCRVTDWDGRIVATQRVLASSGTGTRGTFDLRVPYRADRSGHGEVIVYTMSPKDGVRTDVMSIPVRVTS